MRSQYLVGALAATAGAIPQSFDIFARADTPASIPQRDPDPRGRAADVATTAKGFIYGPSLIGEAAPFPNGTLGNARSKADYALWQVDRAEIDKRTESDVAAVQAAIQANGGLKSLDDYSKVLYDGQWKGTNPRGVAPGIATNYTQDLLFSMERLSTNPYALKLVKPGDALPFAVADDVATKITGATLANLQAAGKLFVVDHSFQTRYPISTVGTAKYGAACTAYFYLHPKTNDFLPLAIKTNAGSDLVYTPLDSPTDWLLGKMIFNANDQFHGQMLHLVISHDVSEGVHQAALHTLSEHHPIMIILERLMLQGYSSRIVGEELCFNPGGHWDQLLLISNVGCRQFVTEQWPVAGKYEAGYLHNNLRARGLINENNEFPFKNFPFFEDADKIYNAYHSFFTKFVDSYYTSDRDVAADYEVRNWFAETPKNALVHGFPRLSRGSPCTKKTLVEVLTHFGFMTSVSHHSVNGGVPVSSSGVLPFHLPALHAPLPTAKGVTDLLPFMPTVADAVHWIAFTASFNRPFYETSGRNLEDALAQEDMIGRLNAATKTAANGFLKDMSALSTEIRARKFDNKGLSQGMPFIYFALDPGYIPFFCAV